MAEPKIITDGYPKKVWLTNVDGYSYPNDTTLIGETSRSWVSGYSFKPMKWSKKEYRIITEVEALDTLWAFNNKYGIGQKISNNNFPADILRKVAELIGYKEPEKK